MLLAYSTKTDRTRVRVTQLEASDLPLGFVASNAVRLFNLVRKAHAPAGNYIELAGREHRPICMYFVLKPGPFGLCAIPIHLSLLRGPSPAHRRSGARLEQPQVIEAYAHSCASSVRCHTYRACPGRRGRLRASIRIPWDSRSRGADAVILANIYMEHADR